MNLHIIPPDEPWETWAVELWHANENLGRPITFTTNSEAIMTDINDDIGQDATSTCDQLIYYAKNTSVYPADYNALILSDCIATIDEYKSMGFKTKFWHKSTRVPRKFQYDGNIPEKKGFVITCDGSRREDGLGEMIKTYFSVCLKDDDDGGLICMDDVNIFSAQEIPFETFNNVYFNGLQPNPIMWKTIKKSKVFMTPYLGYGIPHTAIDSVMLGTPVLIRDLPWNRYIFNYSDATFYHDEQELAERIKYFSEVETTSPEYVQLVEDGFNHISKLFSSENSLNELVDILNTKGDE